MLVNRVEKDSPGEKAGMQSGDIITSINGQPVKKSQDVIDMISDAQVGSTVKMGIVRENKPMTLNVSVGDRTKIWAELYGGAKQPETDNSADGMQMRFGMTVQPLRQSDRDQMKLKGNSGVLIASIEPGSFADDIGLAKGDVIVDLNRHSVNSTEDVKRIQSSLKPGDAVAFHVMRMLGGTRGGGDWQPLFLAGKVPEGSN